MERRPRSTTDLSRHLSPTADNALSSQLELAFEDNRLAAQLYGDFDQNLALIEQRLAVQATPRGNHVMLKGPASGVDQARRVLESLYGLLEEGRHDLRPGVQKRMI